MNSGNAVFTMVARRGQEKQNPNDMSYICISSTYDIRTFSGKEIMAAIKAKSATFTNLTVENGKIESCNGAMDRYTLMNEAGGLLSEVRAVIIDRVETNGNLSGFTIFNAAGVLENVSVAQAIDIGKRVGFSNAKIVGDNTVSSIRGTFPLKSVIVEKIRPKKSVPQLNILFVSAAHVKGRSPIVYAGVIINYTNADSLREVYPRLVRGNNVMKKDINEMAPGMDTKSICITRGPNAGIYAVIPWETLTELLSEAKGQYKTPGESLMVAYINCSKNPEGAETTVKLGNNLEVMGVQTGSADSEHAAAIAKKLVEVVRGLRK